jgi:hypothetical protein
VQALLSLHDAPVSTTHAPADAEHVVQLAGLHALPFAAQAPVLLQSSGCCPLHSTAPGKQEPVHFPALHR